VSYTGEQERAKTSKAKVNAETVKRVAEAYFARNNTYPTSVSQFRSGLVTLPSDIQIHRIGTFDASVGENTVAYKYVGTASSAPGACIYYWSFTPIDSPSTWPGKPANGQPGRTEPEFL